MIADVGSSSKMCSPLAVSGFVLAWFPNPCCVVSTITADSGRLQSIAVGVPVFRQDRGARIQTFRFVLMMLPVPPLVLPSFVPQLAPPEC